MEGKAGALIAMGHILRLFIPEDGKLVANFITSSADEGTATYCLATFRPSDITSDKLSVTAHETETQTQVNEPGNFGMFICNRNRTGT